MAVAMKPDDFDAALKYLRIDATEAAHLLHCTRRSIDRWSEIGVPHSITMTVRAWVRLKEAALPWRPNALSLLNLDSPDTIRDRVAARGGAAAPWLVDAAREVAELGPVLITFQIDAGLPHGFRPISYDRTDARPNLERDRHLIEDGIARIALAL